MRTREVLPRLIACDLDGTLIARDNQLSVPVAAAVARVIDAGVPVVAVTGRPWQWVLDLAREHRLHPYAVVSNGAALVEVASGEVENNGLADGAVIGLMERIRAKVPGVAFAIDTTAALYAEGAFQDPGYRGQHVVEDLLPLAERDVVKLIGRKDGLPSHELAALLDEEVLAGVALAHAGAGEWVELLASGVSKASGLALVAERLGVAAAEVWAVGDEWNDVPMFEWAGAAFAMANAPEHVRGAADRVLPSADDDGVALLLDQLLAHRDLPPVTRSQRGGSEQR
jgi:Cof subfamily protein (haloacid dehalogenase superfamily)